MVEQVIPDAGKLVELAERCEAASGPDRELDCRIFIEADVENGDFDRLYTASLDAAMTLCEPHWWVNVSAPLSPDAYGYSREDQRQPRAGMQCIGEPYSIGAIAATMPLAICAMALRARAVSCDTAKSEGEV